MKRFGLTTALLLTLAVAASFSAAAAQSSPEDPRIAAAEDFREALHFPADRGYVASLFQNPSRAITG